MPKTGEFSTVNNKKIFKLTCAKKRHIAEKIDLVII